MTIRELVSHKNHCIFLKFYLNSIWNSHSELIILFRKNHTYAKSKTI